MKQTLKVLVAPIAFLLFVPEAQMKPSNMVGSSNHSWIPLSRINSYLSSFGWIITYNQVPIDKRSK